MNYLVTIEGQSPFFTNWFTIENHYTEGMIVYDLINFTHCYDGKNWINVETDHL